MEQAVEGIVPFYFCVSDSKHRFFDFDNGYFTQGRNVFQNR